MAKYGTTFRKPNICHFLHSFSDDSASNGSPSSDVNSCPPGLSRASYQRLRNIPQLTSTEIENVSTVVFIYLEVRLSNSKIVTFHKAVQAVF